MRRYNIQFYDLIAPHLITRQFTLYFDHLGKVKEWVTCEMIDAAQGYHIIELDAIV